MSHNRILLWVFSCSLVFLPQFLVAAKKANAPALAQTGDAKSQDDREVLKMNAECNDAELRADVAAMDRCETDDFTHTHANGMVEYKTGYIQGVGSGTHKFLLLDLSDVHVRSYGNSAIVEGHIHLRANNSGKIADVHNVFMTVWVKQQGKWREAAWIAVGLPAEKPTTSENR